MDGVKGVQPVNALLCLTILDIVWAGKKNKEHLNYLLISLCGTMKQLCS